MPFQPGISGNPDGTKREAKFAAAVNRAIAQDDGQRLRACAEKLLDLAAEGEAWAVKELADRLDGRPAQALTVAGEPDAAPIAVKAVVEFVNASAAPESP
jgi:hypothetical protein